MHVVLAGELSVEKTNCVIQVSLIIVGIAATSMSSSQPPEVDWERTFSGDSTDIAYSVQHTADGGYIYAGQTQSFGALGMDALVVKTDSLGYVDWYHLYGGTGTDKAYTIMQTVSGSYIIVGFTTSSGAGGSDMYLAKLDSQGDTLWTRTYGGVDVDRAHTALLTDDGGYILGGFTRASGGVDGIYLVKTDGQGDTLWTRVYVGCHDVNIWNIQRTNDGGYVMAGDVELNGSSQYDYFLAKTNETGDTLWTRSFGGWDNDFGSSVQQSLDGGYIVAGWTLSFGAGSGDIYVVKTDSLGDTLWTRTYGGIYAESATDIQNTRDGGYVIAGNSTSFGTFYSDLYLVKIDANGDTIWTLVYGGDDIECVYSLDQTIDGGYIIAGYTGNWGSLSDCWLVKTGPDTSSTHAPAIQWVSHPKDFVLHPAYPNPFNSSTVITYSVTQPDRVVLAVYDILGQRVAVLFNGMTQPGTYAISWHALNSSSGAYFARLQSSNAACTIKMVLSK